MKEKKMRRNQEKGVWMKRKGEKMRKRKKYKKSVDSRVFFFLQSCVGEGSQKRKKKCREGKN